MRPLRALLLCVSMLGGLSGCIVVKPVVGAGAAVGTATAKGAAKVTTKAIGAAADAVVPDGKPDEKRPADAGLPQGR